MSSIKQRLIHKWFLPGRFALSQLLHEKVKLFTASLGVMFATLLVFMQLGFRDSLYASIVKVPHGIGGDIFLIQKQTEALWRTSTFGKNQLLRTLGHEAVLDVIPLYVGLTAFKNPLNRTLRTLMVLGVDPNKEILTINNLSQFKEQLNLMDTIVFDNLSRPEFGPVKDILTRKIEPENFLQDNKLFTELGNRKVEIIGTFNLGASFAADGNVITSDNNFLRIFRNRDINDIDIGIIKIKPGYNPDIVAEELKQFVDEDIVVLTHKQLVDYEMAYWSNNAPIGFIFGFGVIMGLVVGMVIVYQILFTDINNHINEYATLKAIGYSHTYLLKIVFASALYLALIGFIPGFLTSAVLYKIAESVIFIPMPLPVSKVINIFTMILIMCFVAGALAMQKLKDADPADMF